MKSRELSAAVDGAVLDWAGHPRVPELFTVVVECFPARRRSLSAVLVGLLTSPEQVANPARLSLSVPGYTHSGLCAGLSNGQVDTARLTATMVGAVVADPLYVDVYSVDATSWARPAAPTVDSRVMAHDPAGTLNGSPATPGWAYTVVAAQTRATSAAAVPVAVARLAPGADHNDATVTQLVEVATAHTAAGGSRPLFVADSGYSPARLVLGLTAAGVAADVLVRVRTDRVLYERPEAKPEGSPGRPRRHGHKFRLTAPNRQADDSVSFPTTRFGQVTVAAYHRLHPGLHCGHLPGHQAGVRLPLVEHTMLHVSTTARTGRAGWWLAYTGAGVGLAELFWAYVHRFDVEHLFRFVKQTLGLTGFHPGSVKTADVWAQLVFAAAAVLGLCRRALAGDRLPWEKHTGWLFASAGRLRRGGLRTLGASLARLGCAQTPRAGPGRAPGARWGPRKRCPVYVAKRAKGPGRVEPG